MKEEINTMPKTSLYNMEGAAIGEVELSEELFAAPINTAAMHLVVRCFLCKTLIRIILNPPCFLLR